MLPGNETGHTTLSKEDSNCIPKFDLEVEEEVSKDVNGLKKHQKQDSFGKGNIIPHSFTQNTMRLN